MQFARDIVPMGHTVFGPAWACPRQDIEQWQDGQCYLHRPVALPFNAHRTGPHCMCSPTLVTEGELDSAGWADRMCFTMAC